MKPNSFHVLIFFSCFFASDKSRIKVNIGPIKMSHPRHKTNHTPSEKKTLPTTDPTNTPQPQLTQWSATPIDHSRLYLVPGPHGLHARKPVKRWCGSVGNRCNPTYTAVDPPPGHYPKQWAKCPGDEGFNQYAQTLLRAAGLERTLQCPSATNPVDDSATQSSPLKDLWYQRVLAWLVHPATPITRLLVTWQLGAGKTLGMIRVLENYFDDPRSEPTGNFHFVPCSVPKYWSFSTVTR